MGGKSRSAPCGLGGKGWITLGGVNRSRQDSVKEGEEAEGADAVHERGGQFPTNAGRMGSSHKDLKLEVGLNLWKLN